jgi:hypothetical protein
MDTRRDLPEALERDLDAQRIVIEDHEREDMQTKPYPTTPQASNGDNTAVDTMGNIHSGSALPDPIGDTLEGETPEESVEYYQADILDDDPILGSPEGFENRFPRTSKLENIADEEENILDKLIPKED